MENQPYLLVNRLILRGVTKNYEATFKRGLNVVWGDMDTGKSSILNLIVYCLGGSNAQLQYAAIMSNARVVFLEVNLNGTVVTLERDLTEPRGPVRVHSCMYEEIGNVFPRFMAASPSEVKPDGWLSNFILECLGIPRVQIKESKKDDANSDRLSFLDLMRLMYLKQSRVGSEVLYSGNRSVFNKNVEVQKFVFNIHSELLTQLRGQLSDETTEQRDLVVEREVVHKFLAAINVSVDGDKSISERTKAKQSQLETVERDIAYLKTDFALTSHLATEMKMALATLRSELDTVTNRITKAKHKQDNFSRLRETYRLDLDNLKAATFAHEVLADLRVTDKTFACPLCSSHVNANWHSAEPKALDKEMRSLRNRIAGLDEAIVQVRNERIELLQNQSTFSAALEEKTSEFDSDNISEISGLVQTIEQLEKVRTSIGIEVAELERTEAISRRFADIDTTLQNKAATIDGLKRAIKDAEEGAVDHDGVIEKLSGLFSKYMENSGLRNVQEAYLDNRFTPFFRGISYYQTSSGGVRTIASIGAYLIRLQYLLEYGGQLPSFLMIDTPGQNIGRYKRPEDSEAADPAVYENIYEQILSVIEYASNHNLPCQVIVVDNDLPTILSQKRNFHLVKRFSKGSPGHEHGLVNDVPAL